MIILKSCLIIKQQSLANAKTGARQPWYIGRKSLNPPPFRNAQQYQRNLYIIEKYATIHSFADNAGLSSFV